MNRQVSWWLALWLLWAGVLLPAQALEVPGAREVQVHGFLSQGFTWTSGNRWYGRSEDGSPDFLEAGINLSYRPFSDLMLAAQGLYRRVGMVDPNQLRLDYALADWTFWSRPENRAGVLLGRVKNPFGLYNETRDVAFTRPTVFLPQSIYFDRTRNLGLASDGVQLYAEHYGDWGDWFLRLGLGWPNGTGDKEFERLVLGRNRPGDFEPRLSYIGRLSYEYRGGLVRLAVTGAAVNDRYRPGRNDVFKGGESRLQPLIFSAQYNGERLSLTGEYALRFIDIRGFGRHLPDTHMTGESYYLQGAYRVLPKVAVVLRYDVYFADRDDTSGRRYARLTGAPRHTRFARDWTVGLRWDVTPWWMLRAEWHKVDGTGWLAASENGLQGRQRRWHLFALLTSFRF